MTQKSPTEADVEVEHAHAVRYAKEALDSSDPLIRMRGKFFLEAEEKVILWVAKQLLSADKLDPKAAKAHYNQLYITLIESFSRQLSSLTIATRSSPETVIEALIAAYAHNLSEQIK